MFPEVWVFLRVQSWYNWLSQQQSNSLCLFTYSQLLSIIISWDVKHYCPAGARFAPECRGIIKCKRVPALPKVGYVDGRVTVNLGSFKTYTICMFELKVSYTSQQHIAVWRVHPDVNSKDRLNPFYFFLEKLMFWKLWLKKYSCQKQEALIIIMPRRKSSLENLPGEVSSAK